MSTDEVAAMPVEPIRTGIAILPPVDQWDSEHATGLSPLEALTYRSNLLGADRSVANWGGGNTSTKVREPDYRGVDTDVLWIKPSGSDLATIRSNQFTALRLDDIRLLEDRPGMEDDDLVRYYDQAALRPGQPRASIETPLHSMLPFADVDHTHPDAIIALCAVPEGRALARRIWGDGAIWIDYERPGFSLGKKIARAIRERPDARCVLMAKHGLVTWGDSSQAAYSATIETIGRAADALANQADRRRILRGADAGNGALATIVGALPALRGALSARRPMILHLDASEESRYFASRPDIAEIAQVGPACPDHLVHTKPWPLVIPAADVASGTDTLAAAFRNGVAAYEERYRAYWTRHASSTDPQHDPAPRIVLVPGVGIIAAGPDAAAASVSAALYHRATAVLSVTDLFGGFEPLTEAETYAIEYWPLELYKLAQVPARGELAGRVVLVTGGASGIGREIARKLASSGAHVVIADRDTEGAGEVVAGIVASHGPDRAYAMRMDVTDEPSVVAGFAAAVLKYGGIDIVVSNAGISSSAAIEETTLADWATQHAVLATGYFLVAREAFRVMRLAGRGGSIVFIASKNALVAGKNAAAYSSAKAAELHLARCLAEEGGPAGIRVNSVNPDAVLRGSGIWDSSWREERAKTYGIDSSELEAYYRTRTTLKVSVGPEDVAEAVLFFASDRSAKSTGNILNVDGGVAAAFPR